VARGSVTAMRKPIATSMLLPLLLLAAGCGSSSSSSGTPSSAAAGTTPAAAEGGAASSAALSADAKSAATGDIPDTQNFLALSGTQAHVSMLYPEGWTVQETPSSVSIASANNLVRISIAPGPTPTSATVAAQLATLARSTPGLKAGTPNTIVLRSGPAVKASYSTLSAPNPVTGKQVTLMVDRYELAHGGRVATVDLGTPVGVDNVDAYKKMIESFKWL